MVCSKFCYENCRYVIYVMDCVECDCLGVIMFVFFSVYVCYFYGVEYVYCFV